MCYWECCFLDCFSLGLEMTSNPLRYALLGVTLWGDMLLGKLAFQFCWVNNLVYASQVVWVSSKPIPYDDDTLHFKHQVGFMGFWCIVGEKPVSGCHSWGQNFLKCIFLLVHKLILELQGWIKPIECIQFFPLYIFILCVLLFLFLCFLFFAYFSFFWDFVGISSANPHETLLVHLGNQGI